MNRALIRSTLFNILFYSWTGLCCLLFIPFYILPRSIYLGFVRFWLHGVHLLEVTILNLRYEIRGYENLPASGPYIVAAKHQSAYETMKIHLLFKDPAIILKQELLKIPFWGPYLKKADVIAIDRSTPDQAIQSIQDGARRVQAQNRPIIIFPQGTRVWPDETASDKPYKVGVARIQEATNLPIIPLAMNTGMFWPRRGWLKSPGKVIFEFLPAIKPGLERSALLKTLETATEEKTMQLMEEARANQKKISLLKLMITLFLLALLYTALWFGSAKALEYLYLNTITDNASITRAYASPVTVTGFPGPMVLTSQREIFNWGQGTADIQNIKITSWPIPLPLLYIDVEVAQADINDPALNGPMNLNDTKLRLSYFFQGLTIHDGSTLLDNNPFNFDGKIGFENPPKINLLIKIIDTAPFIEVMKQRKFLNDNNASWVAVGLEMYRKDGVVELPVQQKEGTIYLGLVAIMKLDVTIDPAPQRQSIRPSPLTAQ